LQDVVASPLPGPAGNVEYVVWFSRHPSLDDWAGRIAAAVAAGP
jgi:hypothetical protein